MAGTHVAFKDAGVRFKVHAYFLWRSTNRYFGVDKDGNSIDDIRRNNEEMRKRVNWGKNRRGCSRLIGISGRNYSILEGLAHDWVADPTWRFASTFQPRRAIFYFNQRSFSKDAVLLRHEMGHLAPWAISASECTNPNCVMYENFNFNNHNFCQRHVQIIKKSQQ